MVKFTERDIAIVAGLAGIADFLTEGRFSAPVARALKRVFIKTAPIAARGALGVGPRALGTTRLIAMRHPVATGLAVAYVGYTEREKIQALLEQGYEIIEPVVSPILEEAAQMTTTAYPTGPGIQAPPFVSKLLTKRKPSKFNQAIKAGMLAVKKSTSYGGKGKIKPAKKAFSVVVKLAAAKKKKKKAPKSGIRRRIWNAMKGLR
jgi:hypothetical protein